MNPRPPGYEKVIRSRKRLGQRSQSGLSDSHSLTICRRRKSQNPCCYPPKKHVQTLLQKLSTVQEGLQLAFLNRTLNRLRRKNRYRLSYCLTSAVQYKTPSVILFTLRYCFLDPQATARYFCNTRSSEAGMRLSWQVFSHCDRNHGL